MITVSKLLDTRYTLISGKLSIKIRVTFPVTEHGKKKWIVKYYPTNRKASQAEFDKINGKPRSTRLRTLKLEIEEMEQRAKKIVKDYPSATVDFFENMFIQNVRPIVRSTKISELTVPEFETLVKQIIIDTINKFK